MEIKRKGGIITIGMTDEDLSDPQATSEVVEDLLEVDGESKFLVDVSAVPLLTSLQIGTLVTIHLLCYENLAVMKLMGVSERAKIVLKLVGLDKLMEIHHGTKVATESFGEAPKTSESKILRPLPKARKAP